MSRFTEDQVSQFPAHIQEQIDAGGKPTPYEAPAFDRRTISRPEQELQVAIIECADRMLFPEHLYRDCRMLMPPFKVGDLLHHTPNGGGRSKAEGGIFKAMGVRAGYPDLSLDLVMIDGDLVYSGWRAEVKADAGRMSPSQLMYSEKLVRAGFVFNITRSVDQFQEQILAYLALGKAYYRER